jgi:hypothetical protein
VLAALRGVARLHGEARPVLAGGGVGLAALPLGHALPQLPGGEREPEGSGTGDEARHGPILPRGAER